MLKPRYLLISIILLSATVGALLTTSKKDNIKDEIALDMKEPLPVGADNNHDDSKNSTNLDLLHSSSSSSSSTPPSSLLIEEKETNSNDDGGKVFNSSNSNKHEENSSESRENITIMTRNGTKSSKSFLQMKDVNNKSKLAIGNSAGSTTIPSKIIATKYFNKSISNKRKLGSRFSIPHMNLNDSNWKCPNITSTKNLECGCDLPHTLRCSGDIHGLEILSKSLQNSPYAVSLLDCTLRNVSFLSDARIFRNVSLHGLVISSGEIKRVHKSAFLGLSTPLKALGLPSNALISVPWNSIAPLTSLERLDLSSNKIKALGTTDFANFNNLTYLELTDNQISSVSSRAFTNLLKLEVLKLGGNRLGDYPSSLQALGQCYNLRHLDLSGNSISGPLTEDLLPGLRYLEFLNLEKNLIKSIQNKALENFSNLLSLSLRHNQIDVLQDHAFYGLGYLEVLDLSFNGIVAISSASLQHLSRLTTLDLTHNFLRALTSDLIVPLPSLQELKLAGNDISIVAKNALDGAKELISLSLEENPLSCDCTIKSFAEWLQESKKLSSHDLLSATCVTPPRLEGAPLSQVPLESLTCDMDNIESDNANIIEQLEALSKQNYSTHVKDFSDVITLRDLHYSTDYGLILTWTVNLISDFMCDAIFVYKEKNINEILVDYSSIQCESKIINGQNTVSVIVPESFKVELGESYRFCLVLIQEKSIKSELVVGCSNITKLNGGKFDHRISSTVQINRRPVSSSTGENFNDLSNLDKISSRSDEISSSGRESESLPDRVNRNEELGINGRKFLTRGFVRSSDSGNSNIHPHATTSGSSSISTSGSYDFVDSLNRSFLPGLGLGVLLTTIFILLWGAAKIRSAGLNRPNSTTTTCYAASDNIPHITDTDNGNRYLKLQATTSL